MKISQNNWTSSICNRSLKILAWRQQKQLLLGEFINNNFRYTLCFPIKHFATNFHCLFSCGFKYPDAVRVYIEKNTKLMVTSEWTVLFMGDYCLSRDDIKYCIGNNIKSTKYVKCCFLFSVSKSVIAQPQQQFKKWGQYMHAASVLFAFYMAWHGASDMFMWFCSAHWKLGHNTRYIWAASWQKQQNGMCAQRRLRSARASAQSYQSLRCPHEENLGS